MAPVLWVLGLSLQDSWQFSGGSAVEGGAAES